MGFTLFEFAPTRSARVRWTLMELDLSFDSVAGPEVIGSPAVRAISPLGKVPAIIDAGRPLFESAAICAWLADSHPEHRLIAPSGSWERAQHDQWVSFCLSELEAHLWSTTRNTLLYPEEKRVPAVLEQNREEGRKTLAVLDTHLATTPFLIAGQFSVADIVVGHCVAWSLETGWLDGFPQVAAYLDRLRARPNCPYR